MTQPGPTGNNHATKQLVYPYGETLVAQGETLEVTPGVYWIRMPLPFALDHINLWLLRDQLDGQEGWTIIDCGTTLRSRAGNPSLPIISKGCLFCGCWLPICIQIILALLITYVSAGRSGYGSR
jgi:hypothetical protein